MARNVHVLHAPIRFDSPGFALSLSCTSEEAVATGIPSHKRQVALSCMAHTGSSNYNMQVIVKESSPMAATHR